MNIQEEKEDIIKWLREITDNRIVRQLSILKNSNKEAELSQQEKEAIDAGLQDIKEGKVRTNEEVMELTRQKYPHLIR